MYYGTLIVRFLAKPWEYTLFTSIPGLSFQRVEEFRTNEMLLWLDERALIKGSTDHSCCPGRSKPASYQGWRFVLVLFMGLLRKHFFVSELAIELWLSHLRIEFKTESIYLEERQHIKNAWLCKICEREATIGTHVPSTSLVLKIKLTVQEISNDSRDLSTKVILYSPCSNT